MQNKYGLVMRRGISLRTLTTILMSLKLMSELQKDCGGRTRGRLVRGLIPLCSAVRVCDVRMDDPEYTDAYLVQQYL